MSHTSTLSSSSLFFPPISQTPTIRLEHDGHSGPDERSNCHDLRQNGSFTQTVTPTLSDIKVTSMYLHDIRGCQQDDVKEGEPGWVLQGVMSRVPFRR